MSNAFNKEEKVIFEESLMPDFVDGVKMLKKVTKFNNSSESMERSGDIIWRTQPYIAVSQDGMDQTANFNDNTQLAVPATLGFSKSVPWILDAKEMRDAVQEKSLGRSARQKLGSDMNRALLDISANQGTLVVPVSTAAGDYDDVALCDSIMNEQGIPEFDRYLCLNSRDYNGLASNLSGLGSNMSSSNPDNAYRKGDLGREVAGFMVDKLDNANRITAAAGGGSLTIDTQAAAANYYTPVATRTSATGERSNVDNRYQTITISSTTSVVAGDCFTIAGINAVHHITKADTGQLKTFRVISNDSATTLTISPPIVSNQGATDAEAQYKNTEVAESATAAIVFLNTTASGINPFWHKDAIEILPGSYAVPQNAGANVMRASYEGIELVMQKQYDINTMKTKYRLDTLFGVVNKQPEMSGILLFNQA